jgi:ATP-dependent DNA helicase RecG
MNIEELQAVLSAGEDSRHQFKRTFNNVDAISAEFTAMSNSVGGEIFIGVEDDGSIAGLNLEEIRQLNQSISNAASQCITPPISVLTEIITTEKGRILVITVPKGEMGPYQDKQGVFWIKAGTDKRKAASREEILRQFQKHGMLYAEETLVPRVTIQDIDIEYFEWFYKKIHDIDFKDSGISLEQAVNNMGLAEKQTLNMCGALFLAKNTKLILPLCRIKAVHFAGSFQS